MGFYQKLCFTGAALSLVTRLSTHTPGPAAHAAGASTHATGLAAHTAHLTGVVFRAVVGGDGAAVVGISAVTL